MLAFAVAIGVQLRSDRASCAMIYKDPRHPIEVRVEDLLCRMTLAEKIGQMTQIEHGMANLSAIKDHGIGELHHNDYRHAQEVL